jgi:hypothetical protein
LKKQFFHGLGLSRAPGNQGQKKSGESTIFLAKNGLDNGVKLTLQADFDLF